MPKIVIREFDKTTAGGAAYANFSVVVPGFVKAATAEVAATATTPAIPAWAPNMNVFDDNGVYECTNKEDFEKNVGLTSSVSNKVADAKAPTRAEGWETARALTKTEFDTEVEKGMLYTVVPNTAKTEGLRKDEDYEYTYAEKGKSYAFKPTADATGDTFTLFVRLTDEGHDELNEEHYGNQIAYELLSMGYTVLYKRMESKDYLEQSSFWAPLKDKTLYDFRYIMSGIVRGNATVYANMVDVAEFKPENAKFDNIGVTTHGRGDCVALLDIDETAYKGKTSQDAAIASVLNFTKNNVPFSKYAAVFAPTVTYTEGSLSKLSAFGNNKTFPASFHYLACAARSSERYNEWYANAGYTRGISSYTIDSVGYKFGEAAVNMFQKRAKDVANNALCAINPIINLRGTYYLWGNRTTFALGDPASAADGDLKASHFLNIRQLCSSIKKKVYVACRQITFDPNSDMLWINFCNSIKPLLEKMKADQGIADYKILKVKNDRKAFLSVIIRIVPIEAVEDFDISIYLEDSLEGVIAATAEE
jgi:hypothetical protein